MAEKFTGYGGDGVLLSISNRTITPYTLYIFSSIITFIVIRQYTNAKRLRIEASNRLAMAKMFEKIQQTKDNPQVQIIEELKLIFKK